MEETLHHRRRAAAMFCLAGLLIAAAEFAIPAFGGGTGVARSGPGAAALIARAMLTLGLFGIAWMAVGRPLLRQCEAMSGEIAALRSELASSALCDPLTGLASRRYVEHHLERALATACRSGRAAAVIHVELCDPAEDAWRAGTESGDELLRIAAKRLSQVARKSDLVARIGESGFVIVAEEVGNPRGLERLAKRLLRDLSMPSEIGGAAVTPDAVAGIAVAPPVIADAGQLLASADAARIRAAKDGPGRVRFHEETELYIELHFPAAPLPLAGE